MDPSLKEIIDQYDPTAPLAEAWTIPAPWYVDPRVFELERQTVFARSWQLVGRIEQVRQAGQYITWNLAGEPLVIVRGSDKVLRDLNRERIDRALGRQSEAETKAINRWLADAIKGLIEGKKCSQMKSSFKILIIQEYDRSYFIRPQYFVPSN